MPRDTADLAIAYLLRQGDMGLAGDRSAYSSGGGGGGATTKPPSNMTGGAASPGAGRPPMSARDASTLIESSGVAASRIIQAFQGNRAARPAAAALPPDDSIISGTAGPGGLDVRTPWGRIALGGVAGLVVIGGVIWLITTRKSATATQKAA